MPHLPHLSGPAQTRFDEHEAWQFRSVGETPAEGMSYCGGHGDRLNGMLGRGPQDRWSAGDMFVRSDD